MFKLLLATMVYKCAGFGCKSGYEGHSQQDAGIKIAFHKFPIANKELCDRWIRANPRKDFIPTKHSRLCSLHFQPTDFVENRTDKKASRKRKYSALLGEKLSRRYLKEDAVPSIFPNAPKYLSASSSGPRETISATASSRQEQEAHRMDILEQSFHAADNIASLSIAESLEKLRIETALPDGFTFTIVDNALLIYLLQVNGNIPSIKTCITLQENLSVTVMMDKKTVPASQFTDLFKGSVQLMSELVNLMARVKSWSQDVQSRPLKLNIEMAINSLEDGLENMEDNQSDEYRKISFIIEQLKLICKPKHGRHYSPQLTIMSYRMQSTSSAAYKVLLEENVLCIPSTSTLAKVTRRLDTSTGLNNAAYLKLRVSKLNEFDRNVILMIDEIYIAKRVEYSGEEVQGLTAECVC